MKCRYCGKENVDFALFCAACGSPMKDDIEEVTHQEKKPRMLVILLSLILIALIAVALIVFFFFWPFDTGNGVAETSVESSEEDEVEISEEDDVDGEELYADVLDIFYNNILSDWEDYETTNNYGGDVGEDISYLFYLHYIESDIESVGYAFEDLDDNGIPELLISIDNGEENSHYNGTAIYDLYTCVQGEIVHLASSGETHQYQLCEDNTIDYSGSGGAAYAYYANYILTEDADTLSILECVWSEPDDDDGEDMYWYYSTSEFHDSDAEEISEDEAYEISGSWPQTVELELTPFSSYTPRNEIAVEDDTTDDDDPISAYQTSIGMLDGSTFTMALDADIYISATDGSQSETVWEYIDYTANVNNNNLDSMTMSGSCTVEADSTYIEYSFYYEDGISYYSYTEPISQKGIVSDQPLSAMLDLQWDLTDGDLIYGWEEDGLITLSVDGSVMDLSELLYEVMGSSYDCSCDEIYIELEMDSSGRPSVVTMIYTIEFDISGVSATADYLQVLTFSNYGSATVTRPSDLDSYDGSSSSEISDSQDYDADDDEYILPDSATRYLTREELEHLTAEELRLARNEIYARHGRMFDDEELDEYFRSKSWYVPLYTAEEFDEFGDSLFNKYELANRDLIVEIEAELR